MATSFDQLVRELRGFDQRREIQKACSAGIRKAVAPARKAVKKAAKNTLPKRGGLNVWVGRTRITAQFRYAGRKAGVKLKGGRDSSDGHRTDIVRIDAGRVRAPAWGHKTRAGWHNVAVTPGFFSQTLADLPDWRSEVDAAVDASLEQLRRGRTGV